MGFFSDILKIPGKIIGGLTGETQAEAAAQATSQQVQAGREARAAQEAAAGRAQEFFEPLAGVAQRGIDLSGFLADPQAQFDFLQQNPLFNLALEQAQTGTQQQAAARGRLSAGDTLEQLSRNVLLSAQPLIGQQRQDITNLLNLATGTAGAQANIETGLGANISNLLTDIGATQAAGTIAQGNISANVLPNLVGTAGGVAGIAAGLPPGLFGGGTQLPATNVSPFARTV